MKTLTRAEEQIMQVLWALKHGFLKDIVDAMPEPRPHVNTVATILKILKEKGFVDYEAFGRIHRYSPVVSVEEYSKSSLSKFVSKYFGGNYKTAVSFLVDEDEMSVDDLESLLKEIKKK